MEVPDWFLEVVRCPIEKTPLRWAEPAEVEHLNEAILRSRLHSRVGEVVNQAIDAALYNQSGSYVYLVREGIANLVADDAIEVSSTAGGDPA